MKYYKYTDNQIAEAVKKCESYSSVLRYLGVTVCGGSHSHFTKRIKKLGIDTSHFLGKAIKRGKVSEYKKAPEDILILRQSGNRTAAYRLREALIALGTKYECSKCGGPPEWEGNPLTLDVDHINENWLDDRKENLRFLCPNCHSQFSRKLLGN